jgi:hypothetical protein
MIAGRRLLFQACALRSCATSKQKLKDRIMAAMDDINQHPVVHTWSYKLDEAA